MEEQSFNVRIRYDLILNKTKETDLIQGLVFDAVKDHLKHGKFFLIPSPEQTEMEAYRQAQMHHPENFPMESDESIGFGRLGDPDS